MRDISHKHYTLREAIASASVQVSKPDTIQAIRSGAVPKGNVLELARAAAMLGVKKTPELIPDCHPIPVEHVSIDFELTDMTVEIVILVKTVYKTGVEVEAMHGASVAALTIYDMLKPIDKGVEIHAIRLLEKKGGKTHYNDQFDRPISTALLVISDRVSAGTAEDKAGGAVQEKLKSLSVSIDEFQVVPDEIDQIRAAVERFRDEQINLILTIGGTGLSNRDKTPEAIAELIDTPIPGIMEAARKYGQDRMPYAMLSRGIAGIAGNSLLITLPGSTRGAEETVDALFPQVLHIFKVIEKDFRH